MEFYSTKKVEMSRMEDSQLWTEPEVETLSETSTVLGVKKVDLWDLLHLEPVLSYLQWLKLHILKKK